MVQDASQRRRASRASSELISTTFVVEVLAFIAKIPVRRGQFPDRQANRTLTSMTPIPSISAEMTSPCRTGRSEEHTSELQSLMRISYAVFCLKNKNKHT